MTTRPPTRTQRGFTLIEVMLSMLIAVLALGVATGLTHTTTNLAHDSHVASRVHAEHRGSLLAVANVLRTAVSTSLAGFTDGVATEPEFERTLGIGWHDHMYGGVERLEWRSSGLSVPGVIDPGAVWIVGKDKKEEIIADRVPAGGFEVRQEGRILAIRLTTYYALDRDHTTQLTSETAVTLRN